MIFDASAHSLVTSENFGITFEFLNEAFKLLDQEKMKKANTFGDKSL